MKWFKFDWFTSNERKEFEKLKKENSELRYKIQTIENHQIFSLPSSTTSTTTVVKEYKPYKTVMMSNEIITVILLDGTLISKSDSTVELFHEVRQAKSEEELFTLMQFLDTTVPVFTDTVAEREMIKVGFDILREKGDFIIDGESVFMKGVKIPLPAIITASFIEILEKGALSYYKQDEFLDQLGDNWDKDENDWEDDWDWQLKDFEEDKPKETFDVELSYRALKMFWLKLSLNPLSQSRSDLLTFVKTNDVRITSNGNLVLYRKIVKNSTESSELVAFVSQQYDKIKRWKKSPNNYFVFKVGNNDKDEVEYIIGASIADPKVQNWNWQEIVGNLNELYQDLPNLQGNVYTSFHNKGVHTIKIGSVYKIDDSQINLNNGLCAAGGLHAAAVSYNYSSFGDTPVVVLVNPSKAITVPVNETGKLRTTEMFIACINDKPLGVHFDDGALTSFDTEYHDYTLEELEDMAKEGVISISTQTHSLPEDNIKDIIKMISEKIKQID